MCLSMQVRPSSYLRSSVLPFYHRRRGARPVRCFLHSWAVFSRHTQAQVITASLSVPVACADWFCVSELSVCGQTLRLNAFWAAIIWLSLQLSVCGVCALHQDTHTTQCCELLCLEWERLSAFTTQSLSEWIDVDMAWTTRAPCYTIQERTQPEQNTHTHTGFLETLSQAATITAPFL